jgi:medium-chain acyl-[acyl-carrier-protein] hydrolase
MTVPFNSNWFPHWNSSPKPLTLIAFPHAGAGAGVYGGLRRAAPEWLDIQPVQLPGREDRLSETMPDTLDALLERIVPAMTPVFDRPFALMGYSMGARIACALAHRLESAGLPMPKALVLAAHASPSEKSSTEDASKARFFREAESGAFWEKLKGYGGTPEAVFEHPDLMTILEPMLRADFNVAFSPLPSDRGKLSMPILALSGVEDVHSPPSSMMAWGKETSGPFRQQSLAGGHFFFYSSIAEICQIMVEFLSQSVPSEARTL